MSEKRLDPCGDVPVSEPVSDTCDPALMPLFNSGVEGNIWLSIQIFDLNRRELAPDSGFRDRGRKFS